MHAQAQHGGVSPAGRQQRQMMMHGGGSGGAVDRRETGPVGLRRPWSCC